MNFEHKIAEILIFYQSNASRQLKGLKDVVYGERTGNVNPSTERVKAHVWNDGYLTPVPNARNRD
jgi:hypothetical protein